MEIFGLNNNACPADNYSYGFYINNKKIYIWSGSRRGGVNNPTFIVQYTKTEDYEKNLNN